MRFVSMVTYRDYVLAITEDGELWKIVHSDSGGDVRIYKIGKVRA